MIDHSRFNGDPPAAVDLGVMEIQGDCFFRDVDETAGWEKSLVQNKSSGIGAEKHSPSFCQQFERFGEQRDVVELNIEHLVHLLGAGDSGRIDDDDIVFCS